MSALSRFCAALDATQHSGRVATVLHIGDSHIASDALTRRVRVALQRRFGNAGRGTVLPANSYGALRADGVELEAQGTWESQNVQDRPELAFGISGVRVTSRGSGASMAIKVIEGSFDWAEVTFLRTHQGGRVEISVDDRSLVADIGGGGPLSSLGRIHLPGPGRRLSIAPRYSGFSVLDWTLGKDCAGVRYSNLGVPGATVAVTKSWSDEYIANELGNMRPDLIVVGYGSNELQDPELSLSEVEAGYQLLIARLRASASSADILVLAPPPLAIPRDPGSSGAAADASADLVGDWTPAPKASALRQMLSDLAGSLSCGFLDLSLGVGGDAAVSDLCTQIPPLLSQDRVHFTSAGYRLLSRSLSRFLLGVYATHQARGTLADKPRSRVL